MEVVIPIRSKGKHPADQNEPAKLTPTRVKKSRHSTVTFDTDYSPGRSAKASSPGERKMTRSLKRRSSSSFSAGPSRTRMRSNTPSPSAVPMSPSSSSSTERNNLQSLTTAVDFITHPDAILVESGDDLEMIISSDMPVDEKVAHEDKPAFDIDPVHHAVDMRKLGPSPEPEDEQDPEIDCAICYESIKVICKRAEEEGKGGIGGSLAVFACDQAGCGGSEFPFLFDYTQLLTYTSILPGLYHRNNQPQYPSSKSHHLSSLYSTSRSRSNPNSSHGIQPSR